jgi:predicted transposase YbfD/YdcC
MDKLLNFAKSIKDFRLDRKKLHPAENIVFITIVALICGAEDWDDIEDFGNIRKRFFTRYLDLTNGIPSHDTFNRFFSLYNPKKFQDSFVGWMKELLEAKSKGNQIALDGKSLLGTVGKDGSMLHLLHAYLTENHCLLGQQKTADKSNEITAIPQLLELLDIEEAVVSIDAMGCQTQIAKKIIEGKGDYFLAVKQNQKNLYQDIESAFLVYTKDENTCFSQEELNGSRVEKRTCKIIEDLGHIEHPTDWVSLRSIVKIETETFHKSKNKTTYDTRYYITSKQSDARQYLNYSRNHWKIENKLHWALDVILKEDQSRKRNNNVA